RCRWRSWMRSGSAPKRSSNNPQPPAVEEILLRVTRPLPPLAPGELLDGIIFAVSRRRLRPASRSPPPLPGRIELGAVTLADPPPHPHVHRNCLRLLQREQQDTV